MAHYCDSESCIDIKKIEVHLSFEDFFFLINFNSVF